MYAVTDKTSLSIQTISIRITRIAKTLIYINALVIFELVTFSKGFNEN